MATLRNRLLQMEWAFHALGLDAAWNELFKAAESTLPTGGGQWTGVPAGIVKLGDIDFANTNHLAATTGIPNTGAPIPPGINNAGWGVPNVTLLGSQSGGAQASRPPTLNEP